MLQNGFYTAVGTPLDESGRIITNSLEKQIHDQIEAGAAGILLFGTMGMGGCIHSTDFEKGIKAAIKAVDRQCPLLVGASENSITRAADKINILNQYDVDGIVMTPPYYLPSDNASLVNFFWKTAAISEKSYYLYDNPAVTKQKITFEMIKKLLDLPNLRGIKSGDLVLAKQLMQYTSNMDFAVIYSNFEFFDVAYAYGITKFLDGIFACMPSSAEKVWRCIKSNDITKAKSHFNKMMETRELMLRIGIWPAFTHAMNLLGYKGCFSPDYINDIDEAAKKRVQEGLEQLGEL